MPMGPNQSCSVLIPYYNKEESIGPVLEAVIEQQHELTPWTLVEILILIDGCLFPDIPLPDIVRCIRNSSNHGLVRARNQLIQESRGDFLIFLDADAIIQRGSFITAVQQWDGQSLLAGREESSLELSIFDRFRKHFWLQTQGDKTIYKANYFFGLIFAAPKTIFDELGLFEEKMHNYGEDIEYSLRLKKAGYNIQYEPQFRVFHHRSDSLNSLGIMIFNHSKYQILAHIYHQCSIISMLMQSLKWIFIATGSALRSHGAPRLAILTFALCGWSFVVKLIYSIGVISRRNQGVDCAQRKRNSGV